MGKVKNDLITRGFSGKVSDLVFRQVDGLTLFEKSPRKPQWITPGQVEFCKISKAAALFARTVLMDPKIRTAYEAMAKEANLKSAYLAAVTDYLSKPEIAGVYSDTYTGAPGSVIYIAGVDHFKLHKVQVSILLPDGTMLESGEAQRLVKDWKYAATQVNATVAGSTIVVKAKDRPGKEVTFERTL